MKEQTRKITCPECDGDGQVGHIPAHVYESYATNMESGRGGIQECWMCGGTGRIEQKEKKDTVFHRTPSGTGDVK